MTQNNNKENTQQKSAFLLRVVLAAKGMIFATKDFMRPIFVRSKLAENKSSGLINYGDLQPSSERISFSAKIFRRE